MCYRKPFFLQVTVVRARLERALSGAGKQANITMLCSLNTIRHERVNKNENYQELLCHQSVKSLF